MQASYKYNLGKTFWVPRVRQDYKLKTVEVDGYEYERTEITFHPYVKEKKIVDIQIAISESDGTTVQYYVENIGPKPHLEMSTTVDEEDLNCFTHDEAMKIAEEHAAVGELCYDY